MGSLVLSHFLSVSPLYMRRDCSGISRLVRRISLYPVYAERLGLDVLRGGSAKSLPCICGEIVEPWGLGYEEVEYSVPLQDDILYIHSLFNEITKHDFLYTD